MNCQAYSPWLSFIAATSLSNSRTASTCARIRALNASHSAATSTRAPSPMGREGRGLSRQRSREENPADSAFFSASRRAFLNMTNNVNASFSTYYPPHLY